MTKTNVIHIIKS